MKTSVIGFPRIGRNRELKFASEKFFRGEISETELQDVAREIRELNLTTQKHAGIDLIASNDFSFYDNVLDTAFLFNIVPQRYKDLGLSQLQTYFAAARGYQGEKGNVKALAMKKWFNTNYHYIVPEFEDDTKIELIGSKPLSEYLEAKDLDVETKVQLIGPFTFLKLTKFVGSKKATQFAETTYFLVSTSHEAGPVLWSASIVDAQTKSLNSGRFARRVGSNKQIKCPQINLCI